MRLIKGGCEEGVVTGVVDVKESWLLGLVAGVGVIGAVDVVGVVAVEENCLLGPAVGVVVLVAVLGLVVLEEQEEADSVVNSLHRAVLVVEILVHSFFSCRCFEGLILRGRGGRCTSWLSLNLLGSRDACLCEVVLIEVK